MKLIILILSLNSVLLYSAQVVGNELRWSDEFNTEDLDLSYWRHHNTGKKFDGFNTKESVKINDGKLNISIKRNGNRIETGAVSTKGLISLSKGYLEFRARFPTPVSGLKCSAQIQSPMFGNKEIDPNLSPEKTGSVLSLVDYSAVFNGFANSVVNWGDWGENRNRISNKIPKPLNDSEYHVFGIEILEHQYRFYIDGVQYWNAEQGISGTEMYLVLGCEIKSALGKFPENVEIETLSIDYIRYYDALPNAPIQLTGTPISNDDWEFTKRDIVSFGAHWDDPSFKPSQPYDHDALKVAIQKGSHRGAGGQFNLPRNVTEAWISYCMKFSSDWSAEIGGKLPGFAASSSRWSGGYGGKPSTGKNGWSARMLYGPLDPESQTIPIGQYIYHNNPNSDEIYGDPDWWTQKNDRLLKDSTRLKRGRWYEITQRLKLNDKGKFNGIIEGWVDDVLVYQRKDLNFTNSRWYRNISRF